MAQLKGILQCKEQDGKAGKSKQGTKIEGEPGLLQLPHLLVTSYLLVIVIVRHSGGP
jgi:hypothetical protein